LNGIGNGPLYVYENNCFSINCSSDFERLNIPIIRFHDVEYFNKQNQAVNISAIFPDIQADALLEASYSFSATDQLMKSAMDIGCRVIFRLGENIQNWGSATGSNIPPADFEKWAMVSERIIAHYEDGWNKGFFYKNIMWEVWNEPYHSQCWDGTFDAYCELYKKVWQYVHDKHPNADVSPSYVCSVENRAKLFHCIRDNHLGIGHFFVHYYWEDFAGIETEITKLKQELTEYGLEADIILNEWNYLSPDGGWNNLATTFCAIQSHQAGAWFAKQLIHMQAAKDLAGAVYYVSDMPGFWTGLYKLDKFGKVVLLPTYDVFKYFGRLRKLGNEITADAVPRDVYVLAASDNRRIGVMLVNYSGKKRNLKLRMNGLSLDNLAVWVKDGLYRGNMERLEVTLQPYEVSYISID
ncbi:hypothetical protein, partial [Parabacteroides sp.]